MPTKRIFQGSAKLGEKHSKNFWKTVPVDDFKFNDRPLFLLAQDGVIYVNVAACKDLAGATDKNIKSVTVTVDINT